MGSLLAAALIIILALIHIPLIAAGCRALANRAKKQKGGGE